MIATDETDETDESTGPVERARAPRSAVTAGVAAALWLVSGALAVAITWRGALPSSVGGILPSTSSFSPGSHPWAWRIGTTLLAAAVVALVVRLVVPLANRVDDHAARFALTWFSIILAGGAAGLALDLATIVGTFPAPRLRTMLDGLGTDATVGAWWGVVEGWLPALLVLRRAKAATTPAAGARAASGPMISRIDVFRAARRGEIPANVPLDPWRSALRREMRTQRLLQWFASVMLLAMPVVLGIGVLATSASPGQALYNLTPVALFWPLGLIVVRLTRRRLRAMHRLLADIDSPPIDRVRIAGRLLAGERFLTKAMPYPLSHEEFLYWFDAVDGRALGLTLLREVAVSQVGDDVWPAVHVCNEFGLGTEHLPALTALWNADWHDVHLNVLEAIGETGSAEAVPVLMGIVDDVPRELEGLDAWRVNVGVMDALVSLGRDESVVALAELTAHSDRSVAGYAWVRLVDLHDEWWDDPSFYDGAIHEHVAG